MAIESEALARACARLADEAKGEDIVILHVAPITTLADYFVLVSARNVRQINAMKVRIDKGVKALDAKCIGIEGTPESGWVLLDFADVIVHVFDQDTRTLYDLEMLWGDAARLEWVGLDEQ